MKGKDVNRKATSKTMTKEQRTDNKEQISDSASYLCSLNSCRSPFFWGGVHAEAQRRGGMQPALKLRGSIRVSVIRRVSVRGIGRKFNLTGTREFVGKGSFRSLGFPFLSQFLYLIFSY